MNEENGRGERVAALEARAKANTRRIEKLEQSTDALNRLAVSVQVMATKQDQIARTVDKLDGKVDAIERKPGKRWDGVVDKVILVLVTGVITWLLTQAGLG